jgi:hypothetical protein
LTQTDLTLATLKPTQMVLKKFQPHEKKIEVLARPHLHIWFCLPAHKTHPKAKPKEPILPIHITTERI